MYKCLETRPNMYMFLSIYIYTYNTLSSSAQKVTVLQSSILDLQEELCTLILELNTKYMTIDNKGMLGKL